MEIEGDLLCLLLAFPCRFIHRMSHDDRRQFLYWFFMKNFFQFSFSLLVLSCAYFRVWVCVCVLGWFTAATEIAKAERAEIGSGKFIFSALCFWDTTDQLGWRLILHTLRRVYSTHRGQLGARQWKCTERIEGIEIIFYVSALSARGWGCRGLKGYRLALYFYIFFYKFSYLRAISVRKPRGEGRRARHNEAVYFYRLTQTFCDLGSKSAV